MRNEIAKIDLLQHKIKQMEKNISGWCEQVHDHTEALEKLNRWINLEQFDIEQAREMIAELEKKHVA